MKAIRYHYMASLWLAIWFVIIICVALLTQRDGKIYPPLLTGLLAVNSGGMTVIYIRGFWKITDWGKDKVRGQLICFLLMLSLGFFTILCGYSIIEYLIKHA